ncbi:MAG: hypothetical protein M1819_003460 [Sarea resinae]|nr:MAG: hypothetical protein M1819_003460 [Sarea resinae]
MNQDSEACKASDTMYIVWKRNLEKHNPNGLAAKLAAKHRGGIPVEALFHSEGALNRCYRVKFQGGQDALVRLPILGRVAFRKEKVADEIAVMEYLARNSSIAVPRVLGSGTCGVGPYMVMEFVEGELLSNYLKAPSPDPTEVETLDPNISLSMLKSAYRGMARIVLALSKCQSSRIGAIIGDQAGSFSVDKRAVTFNLNELVTFANYPPSELPQHPFSTATDYFVSLAEGHMRHLENQRNDAIDDAVDCRRKYVARCLFLKIARGFSTRYNTEPFRLFCDDLRPANVIVGDDLSVRGVIDWEFCYMAPAEFTFSSPWWLLLAHPDNWDQTEDSLGDFFHHYLPRQKVFIEVLKDCEDEEIQAGKLLHTQRLSDEMAQSTHNGLFWFCLAARSGFSFDEIYWRFMDPQYYGSFQSLEQRIELLSSEERNNLEEFVKMKMMQAEERKLDQYRTLDEVLAS